MYRSYKVVARGINNQTLLRNYIVTSVVAALFCALLIVVIDMTGDKSALAVTSDGYCAGFFNHYATTRIVLLFLIGIITLLQLIIFLMIAITFYLMVKRQCRGKGPSDWRVSITLMSTIGMNTILLTSLLLAGVEGESTVIATIVATSVEQVTLLLIFVTYQQARKKLWLILSKHCKYVHSKRQETNNPTTLTRDISENTLRNMIHFC